MQPERCGAFAALHVRGTPLLMPNPWDAGSARLLASLGFKALATTSSGFAATLGRLDGSVTRAEAIAHAAALVAATALPVSADLEDCFASSPGGVAETVRLALQAGLAGCSIEDYDGRRDSSSPLARRTTSTGATTSATRSRACRPTRRPAPTCSTRRACGRLRTSAPSWTRCGAR
jgi:2-methylisocitrate lyase-like PEP mutase family enzyme